MTIPILYEHEDFIVVHKPHGLLVHSNAPSLIKTLQSQLRLDAVPDPVHRLDKDTSGVIVVSKKKSATSTLSKLFQSKQVSKQYIALSNCKPKKKQGKIVGDMEKSRNGSYKLLRTTSSPAITRFSSVLLNNRNRLFFLSPLTGKTHQLRVALKSLSSPIIGDNRYGGKQADRMYLHAYAIEFTYMDEVISVHSNVIEGEHWPQLSTIKEHLHYKGM